MNTFVTQTVYAPDDAVLRENNQVLRDIENAMSRTIPDSDIARMNEASGRDVTISAMTAQVISDALRAAEDTDGAFNPALGSVIDAWGFGTEDAHVPDEGALKALLEETDFHAVTVSGIRADGEAQANAGGTRLDLGGCVKGYALDRLSQNLADNNISSAIISVGGSLYATGEKPGGGRYRIGIRDPEGGENDYMATMELDEKYVSTSGTYERGFTEGGAYYHHLIDPQTGYPAQNGLLSAVAVCDSGFLSDVYSTALFVMGAEKGIRFAQERNVDALFLTDGHQVLTTLGFAEKYSLQIKNNQYVMAE